jgi:carbamoyl-phosphate synthase/aspartate carbamoyltransferase
LTNPSDQRLFAIANAMNKGYSVDKIWEMTNIDKWFLNRLMHIVSLGRRLNDFNKSNIPGNLIRSAKQLGFSDRQIANHINSNELAVRRLRQEYGVIPFVKQIDTVAAEFPAFTNYLYMTYNAVEHDVDFNDNGVMVLGSGVYRIGSSVEFDWCAVRAIRTIREQGIKTVMVNYNPETVSTDYDEADRLYFENISLERVLDIYEIEKSAGVLMAMGGQTPNNIALPLYRQNVKVLGTSPEMIDNAENRYKFSRMCDSIGVDQPLWKELTSYEEAEVFCDTVGFPVLVRPSYVLSGAAMNVVFSKDDLASYLKEAAAVSRDHPVVITKYIEEAKEVDMDAVALDGKLIMHVISEHVENAGVHSGDATLVLPPQDLDPETIRKIEVATAKIGRALNITGPFNIQFIAKNNEIKVIECNVRAARSSPFVSKVMGVDLIEMATLAMLGLPVTPYPKVDIPKDYVGIKVPQFSFSRLSGADPVLGVEMASTGEVACFGKDKYQAYLKALLATGLTLPKKNILFSIGSYKEKQELLPSVRKLHQLGYNIFATTGTADFISEHGIPVKHLDTLDADTDDKLKAEYSLQQHLSNNLIDLYINLPSRNRFRRPASYMSKGYRSRRMAVDYSVPLLTNVKCAKLFIEALARHKDDQILNIDWKTSHTQAVLPGLFNISAYLENSEEFAAVSKASLSAGFTTISAFTQDVTSDSSLDKLSDIARKAAYTDYLLNITATAENASKVGDYASDAAAVYINTDLIGSGKVSVFDSAFSSWPVSQLVVTDAKGTDLASILLLASLHNRVIHVSNVMSKGDLALIKMSKKKGLAVTCDVAIYSLFFHSEDFNDTKLLPTKKEQETLWKNLSTIDCFTVGTVPRKLAAEVGQQTDATAGIHEALPLLLGAVSQGRLTIKDISERLYDNPRAIFGISAQPDTSIEVVVDRKVTWPTDINNWSPLAGITVHGTIERIILNETTMLMDGSFTNDEKLGRDVSLQAQAVKTSTVKESKQLIKEKESQAKKLLVQKTPEEIEQTSIDLESALVKKARAPRVTDSVRLAGAADQQLVSLQTPRYEISASLARVISRSPFYRKHILRAAQFDRDDLHLLFAVAHEMRNLVELYGSINLLQGRVMSTMFFEPSTRTSCSFEAAMSRLGGQVVSVSATTSSVQKGESLADTVRTLGCYADLIVLRHPQPGSAQIAAKYSKVPVINAGDGIGEHPTQAFLDTFTIREELGTVNGLTITLVGDLKNGRTVHSLVKILTFYQVTINYVSPESLAMPKDVMDDVAAAGIKQNCYSSLDEVIGTTDVLYMTRVQKERFGTEEEYRRVKDAYILNNDVLSKAKSQMIVMHPLPRVNEIEPEVDFDQRAAYFRQMRYGLFVRMALLALVLGTLRG